MDCSNKNRFYFRILKNAISPNRQSQFLIPGNEENGFLVEMVFDSPSSLLDSRVTRYLNIVFLWGSGQYNVHAFHIGITFPVFHTLKNFGVE